MLEFILGTEQFRWYIRKFHVDVRSSHCKINHGGCEWQFRIEYMWKLKNRMEWTSSNRESTTNTFILHTLSWRLIIIYTWMQSPLHSSTFRIFETMGNWVAEKSRAERKRKETNRLSNGSDGWLYCWTVDMFSIVSYTNYRRRKVSRRLSTYTRLIVILATNTKSGKRTPVKKE